MASFQKGLCLAVVSIVVVDKFANALSVLLSGVYSGQSVYFVMNVVSTTFTTNCTCTD